MPLTGSWLFGRIVAPAEHAPAGDTTASRHEAVVSRPSTYACPHYPAACGYRTSSPSSP
jgi:hypothetical protein